MTPGSQPWGSPFSSLRSPGRQGAARLLRYASALRVTPWLAAAHFSIVEAKQKKVLLPQFQNTTFLVLPPESRIMKGADGFVQAYNVQVAVEPDLQLIVGQGVTQEANDKQQMQPVVEAIREQSRQKPAEVVSDSGYCSEANLHYLEKKKIEGFVAVDRESYRDRQKPSPRGPLPKGATRVDRMRRKLQTKMGAAIYSTRKTVVEPVFGQIKQARGFRQFLLRGLKKVRGEWAIICLTHNILKLHRLCYGKKKTSKPQDSTYRCCAYLRNAFAWAAHRDCSK